MARRPFDPDNALGGLFNQGAAQAKPWTVSEASANVKQALTRGLPVKITVIGELSQLTIKSHWYFSLKDASSQLSGMMWQSTALRMGAPPPIGTQVLVTGTIDHYAPKGKTQIVAQKMELSGAGELDRKFRAMCEELRGKGYFEAQHKLPLPQFPKRIAILTSHSGAAINDCVSTAGKRMRSVELLLVDIPVQGAGAAEVIAQAIRDVDRRSVELGIDLILVTRGGGSPEDLWAFNEREVAEATFACRCPIVSAIGHEHDTTVIDLVADAAFATPTQAIERTVPDARALLDEVEHLSERSRLSLSRRVDTADRGLAAEVRALKASGALLQSTGRTHLLRAESRLERMRPAAQLASCGARLVGLQQRISTGARTLLARRTESIAQAARTLDAVSPLRVLERGFAVVCDSRGQLIRSAAQLTPGSETITRFGRGEASSIVKEVRPPLAAE